MSYLSIRKLPLEVEKAIKKETLRRNVSKSEVVIQALKDAFHLQKRGMKIRRDIRHFFGKMNENDYREFQKVARDFSKIDTEIWENGKK